MLNHIRQTFMVALALVVSWTTAAQAQVDHNSPFPPHKIMANVYYVGTGHISVFLVTTPKGHILINSGFESTVPYIRASVEALGFSFRDIKILLGSHWHHDHMEGDALIKELTGAEVAVMDRDIPDLRTVMPGGKPHPVDRVLHDGDLVELGGTTLTAILMPGHTEGCTDWAMTVEEDGRTYNLLIAGSLGVNSDYVLVDNPNYKNIVQDNRESFSKARKRPVDVFLGAHPSFYHMWQKHERLLARKPGDPNPFIDPAGYAAYADAEEQWFEQKLRTELVQKNGGQGE